MRYRALDFDTSTPFNRISSLPVPPAFGEMFGSGRTGARSRRGVSITMEHYRGVREFFPSFFLIAR
jgi:hypothetical protein